MNNHKQTKRALLTSVMALVMCVVMLVGTTFAWFTDTASTNVNTIKAGKLKVLLMDEDGNDLEGKTLNFLQMDENSEVKPNDNILWEPGATYQLPKMQIKNDGDLALKYKIDVSGAKVADGAPAKSLDLLNVLEWTYTVGGNDYALNSDKSLGVGKTDTLVIKAHMKETANNDYQGMAIDGIAITVYATQDTVEYDSTTKDYDKDAQYSDVDVVTVTPNTIPSPFKANTAYFFEAGNYGDQHFVITDKENVTLIGKTGAKFDSLQISSIDYVNSSIGQEVDLDNSTLTVKGFEVTNVLDITVSDKNVVAEDNTAGSIKIKTNVSCDNIVVNNNALTGGDLGGGSVTKYGVYVVPNITDYDLTVTNNTFDNIVKHAIGVQGCGDGQAVTAAKSITVEGNKFNSYGTDKDNRAAFKIWADTKLAPNDTDPLNEAAKALAKAVEDNNAFGNELDSTCVVADFYGKTVAFN